MLRIEGGVLLISTRPPQIQAKPCKALHSTKIQHKFGEGMISLYPHPPVPPSGGGRVRARGRGRERGQVRAQFIMVQQVRRVGKVRQVSTTRAQVGV